jgi:hypothetical protein
MVYIRFGAMRFPSSLHLERRLVVQGQLLWLYDYVGEL